MSTQEEKYNNITAKLEQRHRERLEQFEQRRQLRLKDKDDTCDLQEGFLEQFNNEKRAVIIQLDLITSDLARPKIMEAFDNLTACLQKIDKYVSDSTVFLPSYDVRRAQEILNKIRDTISQKRVILLPRKKFAFKSRTKESASKEEKGHIEDKPSRTNSNPLFYLSNASMIGIADKANETITLSAAESSDQDVSLLNIDCCDITILGCPGSVQIKNVVGSTVRIGPVARSVFVNNCADSVFHLTMQQLRIHSTISTTFHIHVTSKAIIEDCTDLGFAPLEWSYTGYPDDFQKSGLNIESNNWNKVDDFNWLKLDEHSPNWCAI